MFEKLIFIFYFIFSCKAASSDGTRFVATFTGYINNYKGVTAALIFLPTEKDSYCDVEYARAYDQFLVKISVEAKFRNNNEHIFPQHDIFHIHQFMSPGVKETNDTRIFITCTSPIKLLGKYSDPIKEWGDIFLIPSIPSNSGKKFIFGFPKTYFESVNYAVIIPLTDVIEINVQLIIHISIKTPINQNQTIKTSFGSKQYILASYFFDHMNGSFEITSDQPIMVQLVSPLASNCRSEYDCRSFLGPDYTTFMVRPTLLTTCDESIGNEGDIRLYTNDFTAFTFVSPLVTTCKMKKERFQITVDNGNNSYPHSISRYGMTVDTMVNVFNRSAGENKFVVTQSTQGIMPIFRQGGVKVQNKAILGSFIHYIPHFLEYVTGETYFYTLLNNCVIEFYAENEEENLKQLTIDHSPPSTQSLASSKQITAFDRYINHYEGVTVSLIFLPTQKDSDCDVEYYKARDQSLAKWHIPTKFRNNNEFIFPQHDIFHIHQFMSPGVKETNDSRVFVTCTNPIKLLGKYSDPIKEWGDIFLIPSIPSNSGSHFIYGFPKTYFNHVNYVVIIPLTDVIEVTVQLMIHIRTKTFVNGTHIIKTSPGSKQYILAGYFSDQERDYTFTVISSQPIMVQLVSPLAANYRNGSKKYECFFGNDYGTFMVRPTIKTICDDEIYDYRLYTNDFTAFAFASPPFTTCKVKKSKYKLTLYNKIDTYERLMDGDEISVSTMDNMDAKDMDFIVTQSTEGMMSTYRQGGSKDSQNRRPIGSFIHYIPSFYEYVTGETYFYTLLNNCVLEFYAEYDEEKLKQLIIDNKPSTQYLVSTKQITAFKHHFVQYIFNIQGYGTHVISYNFKYMSFVVCEHINSRKNTIGYLTGFDNI
uniref:IgGFc_binding domain-containing protein n=1 Tax=Rhabditophanes sp. KR3021 TaxID=114890 RepID=A0AC35U2Y1_9BILA